MIYKIMNRLSELAGLKINYDTDSYTADIEEVESGKTSTVILGSPTALPTLKEGASSISTSSQTASISFDIPEPDFAIIYPMIQGISGGTDGAPKDLILIYYKPLSLYVSVFDNGKLYGANSSETYFNYTNGTFTYTGFSTHRMASSTASSWRCLYL